VGVRLAAARPRDSAGARSGIRRSARADRRAGRAAPSRTLAMSDQHARAAVPENPDVHHETRDINIRGVFAFGVALLVAGIIIHVLVWLMFLVLASRQAQRVAPDYPLAATQQRRLPPEPRLQPEPPEWRTPREDLQDFRRQEDQVLNSYGWVDKNGGAVRIPIDEAMKTVVRRGLPAREGTK